MEALRAQLRAHRNQKEDRNGYRQVWKLRFGGGLRCAPVGGRHAGQRPERDDVQQEGRDSGNRGEKTGRRFQTDRIL